MQAPAMDATAGIARGGDAAAGALPAAAAAAAAAAGPPAPAAAHTTYLLRSDRPRVELTWASRFPRQVDRLKLRKHVELWPVPVRATLRADYDTARREFAYGCSVRDSLFGGDFSLNLPEQRVEYSKRVAAPNGAWLVFSGSASYRERSLAGARPALGVQLEFGDAGGHGAGAGSAVWVGSSFEMRRRVPLGKGLAVEVCGAAALPAPAARYSAADGALALGDGALRLHVAEVNAVLTL